LRRARRRHSTPRRRRTRAFRSGRRGLPRVRARLAQRPSNALCGRRAAPLPRAGRSRRRPRDVRRPGSGRPRHRGRPAPTPERRHCGRGRQEHRDGHLELRCSRGRVRHGARQCLPGATPGGGRPALRHRAAATGLPRQRCGDGRRRLPSSGHGACRCLGGVSHHGRARSGLACARLASRCPRLAWALARQRAPAESFVFGH
jgi:hypothetical protein